MAKNMPTKPLLRFRQNIGTVEEIQSIYWTEVFGVATHKTHLRLTVLTRPHSGGPIVRVVPWKLYDCEGQTKGSFTLSCLTPSSIPRGEIYWTRNNDKTNQPLESTTVFTQGGDTLQPLSLEEQLDLLLDVALSLMHHYGKDSLIIKSVCDCPWVVDTICKHISRLGCERLDFDSIHNVTMVELYARLVQEESLTIKDIFIEHPTNQQGHLVSIFEAIPKDSPIEVLCLPTSRRIHSWQRDVNFQKRGSLDEISDEISEETMEGIVAKLLEISSNPKDSGYALDKLDLSGHRFSPGAGEALAKALPHLSIASLLLRNTNLSNQAVIELGRALQEPNCQIGELDISHCSVSVEAIAEICNGLTSGEGAPRLLTLVMEHCGLTMDHVKELAAAMPHMKTLLQLWLDGNDFTDTMGASEGASLMVNALKRNHTLFSLKMGTYRFRWVIRKCCTGPKYSLELSDDEYDELMGLLKRNLDLYKQMVKSRKMEAFLNLVSMLLTKMRESN